MLNLCSLLAGLW